MGTILLIYLVGVVVAWVFMAYLNDKELCKNNNLSIVVIFTSWLFVCSNFILISLTYIGKLFKNKYILPTLFLLISLSTYSGTAYHFKRTTFDNKFQRTTQDAKAVNVTIGKNNKVFTFIEVGDATDRISTNVVNVGAIINSFGTNSTTYSATDEDGLELIITLITSKPNNYTMIVVQNIDKITVYQLSN
jgi:hypothetical protein